MLSARGIRNACPKYNFASFVSLRRNISHGTPLSRSHLSLPQRTLRTNTNRVAARSFSASTILRQDGAPGSSKDDIEKVVRDAKQRFRDTLPKGYLNDEEYALYERLYGPPLRETSPEDVGIPTHADMGSADVRPEGEGVLLRQLEGGEFEEVSYEIEREVTEVEETEETEDLEETAEADAQEVIEKAPGYVEAVARSKREHDALQALQSDYEVAQAEQRELEEAAKQEEEEVVVEEEEAPSWPVERIPESEDWESGEPQRYHPYTLDGRFHGNPVEVILPHEELVMPIRALLERTHLDHVKAAAEEAFGGPGLPTSPATPEYLRSGPMVGVGLPPDQKHMTEIEADAFLAAYIPPAYASVLSILREVRKRVGSEWLQSRLKQGREAELSVLDVGTGGAGLIAWEQILKAEWEALKENGEVRGPRPPGKKSVIIGSDRLRHRTKTFLHNTSFLPRIPDYEHSGETHGRHLDAGDQPQARKSYDVVIASHLFMKETQAHLRAAALGNLWRLVNKNGGILIVIEKAHPRGFEATAHVRDTLLRDFILPQSGSSFIETDDVSSPPQRPLEPGHVIAPCTTQGTCPMYTTPGKSVGRKDYCHFSQRFVRPMFHSKLLGGEANPQGEVEFSYVAVRRGVAKDSKVPAKEATDRAFEGFENSDSPPDMQTLPRILSPALKRKGHVTMDVCTAEGKVERWTVPKSFSHLAYHDARKSRWGDLWALGAKTRVPGRVRAGSGVGVDADARAKKVALDARRRTRQVQRATLPHEGKNKKGKGKEDKAQRLIRQALEVEQLEEALVEKQIDEEMEDDEEETKGGR